MEAVLITRFWLLLAGVGGAILPVAIGNEGSRGRALIQVVCGALVAIFLAPALEHQFFPKSPPEIDAGVSFLVGCFGLRLAMIMQKLIDNRGEALANRVIDRIAGHEEK